MAFKSYILQIIDDEEESFDQDVTDDIAVYVKAPRRWYRVPRPLLQPLGRLPPTLNFHIQFNIHSFI